MRILLVVLVATLSGTAATLLRLRALLALVSSASEALRRYLDRAELPDLPTGYQDEAGKLMSDVRYVAERLEESIRQLSEQAAKDPLTGLYNRRVAQEHLYEAPARIERGGGAFALALVDLDQFKPINDRFGHGTGDACLKHFAEVVGHNVRGGDWVARWGGDEFLVLLWEAGEALSADRALERVAEELRKCPARLPNGEVARLTFSGGVVRCGGQGEDVEGLLERADEAFYRAKQERGTRSFAPSTLPETLGQRFGVPRITLLGTWVNSDGHRAHCVILSGCSRARPARGSDRGCRQRPAQATACPSSWPCSSCLHLLGGAAFAVSVGVALARSDQLRAEYAWFSFAVVATRRGAGLRSWAQLTALFTSAPIFASSAAVNSFSAKEVGHMAPSSRFAASLKPSVAYLELNFCALWKKQRTLPSLLA